MNRRKFVHGVASLAATLPPMPHIVERLRSPKDSDHANKPMRRPRPMLAKVTLAQSAAGLSITGVSVENGFVKLDWIGGRAPYAVQVKIDNSPWTQVGNSTVATTKTFPVQGDHALLRIMDNCSSLLTATTVDGHGHLEWNAPDTV